MRLPLRDGFPNGGIWNTFHPRKGLFIRREAGPQPQEEFMVRKMLLAAAFLTCTSFAAKADMIEGNWKRPTGTIVKFQACGASTYCAVVQTGAHKGKQAGSMKGTNGSYRGSLTDLDVNKTYKGKTKITGNKADMAGCVLGGLICKHEVWVKQ
jgi:uncharacterized protein (DUF2147 family)